MENRSNTIQTIFFVLMMMSIFSGNFSAIFPLMFIYFIANSIIGGQQRRNQRDTRDSSQRNRRYDRNREYEERNRRYDKRESEYDRRRREEELRRQRAPRPQPKPRTQPKPRNNPYKQSGVRKFKEYDYDGATEDFLKALEIDATDVAVHFNIACCYSLNEEKDKAFYHLSKAVGLGFKNFEKIQSHDALAYLRIQDEFEEFKQNGYRLANATMNSSSKTNNGNNNNLLDQLNKLQELRERGVLTEEEFIVQKEKLLR